MATNVLPAPVVPTLSCTQAYTNLASTHLCLLPSVGMSTPTSPTFPPLLTYSTKAGPMLAAVRTSGATLPPCPRAVPPTAKKTHTEGFFIANAQLLPMIEAFNVNWTGIYPVHAALEVVIKPPTAPIKVARNIKPLDLAQAIAKAIDQLIQHTDSPNDAKSPPPRHRHRPRQHPYCH